MAELAIALLSPIAKYIGDWIKKKIKEKKNQEQIKINIESPNYNGTANHWVSTLFEHISKEKAPDLKYVYIGDSIESSIEKDRNVSTIKMNIPDVDKDALSLLLLNQVWNNQNDPIHGNGVFNFALPQIVYTLYEGDKDQIQYKNLSSIPLNGKYMFTTKLETSSFKNKDPNDFYRHGGIFEIPIYLDAQKNEYQVYPVMPPTPNIPEYAIRTKIIKSSTDETNPVFVFCPFCGTKMVKKSDLKFCFSCGKSIKQHLNF